MDLVKPDRQYNSRNMPALKDAIGEQRTSQRQEIFSENK
jgi:hypothetical protein